MLVERDPHSTAATPAVAPASTSLIVLGAGAALLAYSTTRRSRAVQIAAATSVPLLYWAVGRWPRADWLPAPSADTRRALGGGRGIHVRDAIRLELPIAEVYGYWRRLENLPRLLRHVESVSEDGTRSHWVATGPGGLRVEWDAELINDEPEKVIAWRSLAGSDVTTAGSVKFDRVRGGGATQLTVTLQYALPAGKTGAAIAALFGREPSQMIREDLRRLKQLLEAGEIARASRSPREDRR